MNTDGKKISNAMSPGIISVLKNTTYILSGQGVQFGVRFVYAIILARFMGPHDYGLIAYGTSLYLAVMPLSKLGVEHVVIRIIGCDKEGGRTLLQSAQPLRKLITYLIAGIFAAAAFLWEPDPQTSIILAVFSLALVGRSFAGWNNALFTAYEANQYSFRMQTIFRPTEVVLGLCALALWHNPLSVVLAHAATWWLEVIFGTILLRKNFSIPKDLWNPPDIKRILREAAPIGLAAAMSLAMTQGPLIFFKNASGSGAATGNLALAMQIFAILSQLPIAANNASYPLLSRVVARGDGKENIFVETMLRLIIFWGTLLALIGMAIGGELVTFVFGQNYAETGDLIGLTLWLMIPWSAMNALGRVHMARQKARTSLIFLTIGTLCFILTVQPATDALNFYGPVAAVLFSMSLTSFMLLASVHYDGKINLGLAVVRPMCAVAISLAVFHSLPQSEKWLKLIIPISTLITGWLLFKCVSTQEIRTLVKLKKRF
jgi:O-antigen/teichoic acid export membrane protein